MILNFQKAIKSKSKNTSTPILLAIMMVCFSFKTFAQFIPSQGIPNLPIDIPANIQLPNLGSSRIQSGSRLDDQPRKQILDPLEKAKQDSTKKADELELKSNKEKEEFRNRIFGYSLFHNTKSGFGGSLKIATPKNYILGPDDELLIEVSGISVFQDKKIITPEGFIRMGGTIGNINVAGKSIDQAKSIILNKLSEIYSSLRSDNGGGSVLSLTLGNFKTVRVSVLGEVSKPGTYPVSAFATISNAIYEAGGITEYGTMRDVRLIRGNKVVANLDIYDILVNGNSKNDVNLRDQDVVQVGNFSNRIILEGKIKKNGIFEILPTENIKDLINYAGGFTNDSYSSKLKIIRNTDKQKKLMEVGKEDFGTFKLQDGDVIKIDPILEKFENLVSISGAIYRPGDFALEENKTLSVLVKNADLKEDAFTGRINVIRLRDDLSKENISVNLSDILLKKSLDLELKKDDQVIILSKVNIREKFYVRIQGAVNLDTKPKENETGYFEYIAGESVEDLILRAGGLKSSASTARIDVFRQKLPTQTDDNTQNEKFEKFSFAIGRDLFVGPSATTFILKPYDQVYVRFAPNFEKNETVLIEGQVVYEGEFPLLTKDQKLSDIIKSAGGLNAQAYAKGATLIRKIKLSEFEINQRNKTIAEQSDNSLDKKDLDVVKAADVSLNKEESIDIDLESALANPGSAGDLILQDGDLIRIPKLLQTVRVQGEVLYPRLSVFQGGNLLDYISSSGGYTSIAKKQSTWIRYANGTVSRTKRFLFFKSYPRVEPGSEIFVVGKTKSDVTFQQVARDVATITGILAGIVNVALIYTLVNKQ